MRLLVLLITFMSFSSFGQQYKELMTDYSVNFYTVCDSAESYFERNGKGEGSGWKGYQRWKYWNEPMFYPSGDRSSYDAVIGH